MTTRQARRQERSERLEQDPGQWDDELREEYWGATKAA